jgi:hypothetical protein
VPIESNRSAVPCLSQPTHSCVREGTHSCVQVRRTGTCVRHMCTAHMCVELSAPSHKHKKYDPGQQHYSHGTRDGGLSACLCRIRIQILHPAHIDSQRVRQRESDNASQTTPRAPHRNVYVMATHCNTAMPSHYNPAMSSRHTAARTREHAQLRISEHKPLRKRDASKGQHTNTCE